jgi:hypothetical protein
MGYERYIIKSGGRCGIEWILPPDSNLPYSQINMSSSPTLPSRTRWPPSNITRACQACRKRRTRCEKTETERCRRCTTANTTCIYPPPGERKRLKARGKSESHAKSSGRRRSRHSSHDSVSDQVGREAGFREPQLDLSSNLGGLDATLKVIYGLELEPESDALYTGNGSTTLYASGL